MFTTAGQEQQHWLDVHMVLQGTLCASTLPCLAWEEIISIFQPGPAC